MDNNLLKDLLNAMKAAARNTEPKESFSIILSGKNAKLREFFSPTIELKRDRKYEMALIALHTYYSFPNIDSTNHNFRYSPDGGEEWVDINIPEGCYEITDINEYIQRTMKEAGHLVADEAAITIRPNNNTLKVVLHVPENYIVDFTTANSIRTVLGFDAHNYGGDGNHESENIVNIISISSLNVTSDIIQGSYSNGRVGSVIYSFFSKVGPGYKIIEEPANLVYLPLTLSTISSMTASLVDQNNEVVNLRGEDLSIRFHIREV